MMDHYSLVQRLTGPLPMMDQSRRLNDFAFELGWRPSDRLDIPASNDFATAHLIVEHGLECMRQRNRRVDKGGGWGYRLLAAQAVGVSSASR